MKIISIVMGALAAGVVFCHAAAESALKFDNAGTESDGKSQFFVPYRQITSARGNHWFAYYDKLECDPSQRYALAMRVDFEGRSPTDKDIIEIGMVDLLDNCKWTKLGVSRAWGWQQGCQLQFIPQSDSEVIWNDREGDKFVARILDVKTGKIRVLPRAIYALSPDGKWAVTVDYSRVNDMRPGYGYKGIPDPCAASNVPADSGIWKVDLKTGESKMIVSIADAVAVPDEFDKSFSEAKHWFNHLLVSPDSKRFIFLNRWRYSDAERTKMNKDGGGYKTRMFTADADGKDLRVIDPYNHTSHFIWEGNSRVLAWTTIPPFGSGFLSIADSAQKDVHQVGKGIMTCNGHQTFLKNPDWILCDTYPDAESFQTVYLYNVKTGKRRDIAKLYSPIAYRGEWRCDTHPRATPDGRHVIVDSPHNGGRQLYIMDISGIVGEK